MVEKWGKLLPTISIASHCVMIININKQTHTKKNDIKEIDDKLNWNHKMVNWFQPMNQLIFVSTFYSNTLRDIWSSKIKLNQ